MTLWLLGTHLDRTADYLDNHERILRIESAAFANRRPYHPHKLALTWGWKVASRFWGWWCRCWGYS
jgi:deoxyribodipyrimidine photolyase-related protein